MVMVGAANWAEWPLQNCRGCALGVQHVDEYMIIEDVDRLRGYLGGNMPIADVPGERQEVEPRPCAHLHDLFGRRTNLDEPARLKQDPIAVMKDVGTRQVEEEIRSPVGPKRDPSAMRSP